MNDGYPIEDDPSSEEIIVSLQAQLTTLRERLEKAERELAEIQSWCESHHNGYSESARAVMHDLKRPESIIQCLNELLSEESDMRRIEADSAETSLAAAVVELPATFYANRPVAERFKLMVDGWRMAVEGCEDLRTELDAAQSQAAAAGKLVGDLMDRMDRARNILTKGMATPECNWGMLDTTLDRAADGTLAAGAKEGA